MLTRKKSLIFKACFLTKIMNLKSNGERQMVMYKIDEWLKENIHLFLKNYKIYKFEEIDKIRANLYRAAEDIMMRRRKRLNEK